MIENEPCPRCKTLSWETDWLLDEDGQEEYEIEYCGKCFYPWPIEEDWREKIGL